MASDYAKVWHKETTIHCKDSKELNEEYFRMVEEKFNARLQGAGVLLIQEVFDYMGLKETSYSKTHGWTEPGSFEITIAHEASPHSILIDFNANGKVKKIGAKPDVLRRTEPGPDQVA